MLKIVGIVALYLTVYCISAALFNSGHLYPSLSLVIASIALPIYYFFKKGKNNQ